LFADVGREAEAFLSAISVGSLQSLHGCYLLC